MALTPKEQAFVAEYLVDLNATQAVLRAGYKVKNDQAAASHGYRLLKKPSIAEAIQSGRAKKAAGAELSAQSVLQGLMRVAFADARKLFGADGELLPPTKLDDDMAGAIAGIEVKTMVVGDDDQGGIERTSKIKMSDRMRALELLGRHLGMFEKKDEKPPADPLDGMSAADLVAVLARLKGGGDVPGG